MPDYVIVGAGSAGCVMANRLSATGSVALLEAGPSDYGWDPRIHMPAALSELLKTDTYNWAYSSDPEPSLNNRALYCPRGKVLGGSSSVNGMIFVRGNRGDFDRWRNVHGLGDWGYDACLPWFMQSENTPDGDDQFRGRGGPLTVTRGEAANPLFHAWLEAGQQAGVPLSSDFNGASQDGVGLFDRSIAGGERQSASKAYLTEPVRERLQLLTGTQVTRILFDKYRAVGVEFRQQGQIKSVMADREVIVCAGAINSPQLLMLSGIGDPDQLEEHQINVVAPLPGVGANLQDHLEVYVQFACPQPVSIYPSTRWFRKPWVGLQWLLSRTGAGSTNHFEAGAFLKSSDAVDYPDLQFHFLPVAMDYDGKRQHQGHGFQVHVGPMKPRSRGRVYLRSADPFAPPGMIFNYHTDPADQQVMEAGIRLAREIVAQPAFDEFRGNEIQPGIEAESSEAIDAFVRTHGESAYHPSCTCKMGADEASVVDGSGRVHGVEQLRVVDASIMPEVTNGNLNAVVIMMAEKIAGQMLAE